MDKFYNVVKEYKRMCNSTEYCIRCPLMELVKYATCCEEGVLNCPEEAERIIMGWAAEHPLITNGKKFREVFGIDLEDKYLVTEHAKEWACREYVVPDERGDK